MCSLQFLCIYLSSNKYLERYTVRFPGCAYHSATTLHVVEVSVSVGAEVQTSGDPGEGTALLDPQTTIWCPVFMFRLFTGTTGGTFEYDIKSFWRLLNSIDGESLQNVFIM